MNKIVKYSVIVLTIFLLAFIVKIFFLTAEKFIPIIDNTNLFNDNNSYALIKIKALNKIGGEVPFFNYASKIRIREGKNLIDIINFDENKSELRIKTKYISGLVNIEFHIEREFLPIDIELVIMENFADSDKDGYYNSCELTSENDRTNFRKWFVNIAVSQFYREYDNWQETEKDCAGLIRYAYREALKKHNDEWYSKIKFVYLKNIGDIKKFNYPEIPVIGTNIFKAASDSGVIFSNFADAKNLMNHSLFFYLKV